jgi:hypothetical protein
MLTATSNIAAHCGDCGCAAVGDGQALRERGWALLQMRSSLGDAILWWRCPRCAAGGAHAVGEVAA